MGDTVDPDAVAEAVAEISARIDTLGGIGRVRLIAVTKGFGADAITAAVAAGCRAIGENYAQELRGKVDELPTAAQWPRPEIHFIGQLQTNKVRALVGIVDVWQTVDRASLAAEIARRAPGAQVFVQVNTTNEDAKGGCPPDATAALVAQCAEAGLVVAGLMTVGPTSTDPEATTRAFATLRGLRDDLGLVALSMGMSGDYEQAIEQGATHVRIGGALFGPRPGHRTLIG